jgi:seryl-tRNA synthetase
MDIAKLRDPETANIVRESQRKRFKSVLLVDLVISMDEQWRKMRYGVDSKKKDIGVIQKQITEKKKIEKDLNDRLKKGADSELEAQLNEIKKANAELLAQKAKLEKETEKEEREERELKARLDEKLNQIGNLVHASVPVSDNEDNNGIVVQWGTLRAHDEKTRPHHELLYMIDGYEPEPGTKVAGHRGYFYKGVGLLLNQALINYSLALLAKKGFTLLQTPFFMRQSVMAKTAQLSDFDEQLYKVVGGSEDGDNSYLIATSEQPISAFHMDEWIAGDQLPIRYAGYSTNFRKEAGGHGRDVWGIFRVHQFEKIEQFVLTDPEKSWDMHEEMLKNAEEFYQSLGIPYRVVNIVSGELNDAAAKKYDLEGWFPGLNCYRELVSCSNCTDYQARRLNITTGADKKYVHMLNSTLCACTRAVCVILETYQTETGVTVPEVLRPYMAGLDFLPFKRQPLKNQAEKKEAQKKGGKK